MQKYLIESKSLIKLLEVVGYITKCEIPSLADSLELAYQQFFELSWKVDRLDCILIEMRLLSFERADTIN
jgi:hypothetical protein